MIIMDRMGLVKLVKNGNQSLNVDKEYLDKDIPIHLVK